MQFLLLFLGFAFTSGAFLPLRLRNRSLQLNRLRSNIRSVRLRHGALYQFDGDQCSRGWLSSNSSRTPFGAVQPVFTIDNAEYLVPVSVGTGTSTELQLVLDTGSGDLWIPDHDCEYFPSPQLQTSNDGDDVCPSYCRLSRFCATFCEKECCPLGIVGAAERCADDAFRTADSSTFKLIDSTTHRLDYQSITVFAKYAKDHFQFGLEDPFSVGELEFGLAMKITDNTATTQGGYQHGGILGLALFTGFPEPAKPAVSQVFHNAQFEHPTFHIYLNYGDEECDGGKIEYGTAEPNFDLCEHEGIALSFVRTYSLCVHPIVFIDGSSPSDLGYHSVPALVDSGSNVIFGPRAVVETLAREVGAVQDPQTRGLYRIPCGTDGLKDIVFTVFNEGKELRVSPANYVIKSDVDDDDCIFGFATIDARRWILGTPFMRQYCSSFDTDQRVMTFRKRL